MAAVQPVTSFATVPRLLLHLFCVAQPYSSILIDLSRPFWKDFNIRLKCPPFRPLCEGLQGRGSPSPSREGLQLQLQAFKA